MKNRAITFFSIAILIAVNVYHLFAGTVFGINANPLLLMSFVVVVYAFFKTGFSLKDKCIRVIWMGFMIYLSVAIVSRIYNKMFPVDIAIFGLFVSFLFIASYGSLMSKYANHAAVSKIGKALIVLAIFQSLLVIIQTYTRKPILSGVSAIYVDSIQSSGYFRATGTFRDPVDIGQFILLAFWYLIFISSYKKLIKICFAFLYLFAILLTQSGTNIVALILSAIMLFLYYLISLNMRFIIRGILFGIGLGIMVLIVGVFQLQDILPSNFKDVFYAGKILKYTDMEKGNERTVHINAGIQMLKESNYLGFGYGTYDTLSPSFVVNDSFAAAKYINYFNSVADPIMVSHVLFATEMGETGVPGLVALVILLLCMFYPLRKTARRDVWWRFYFCIYVGILVKISSYGFRLSDVFLWFTFVFIITGMRMNNRDVSIGAR